MTIDGSVLRVAVEDVPRLLGVLQDLRCLPAYHADLVGAVDKVVVGDVVLEILVGLDLSRRSLSC